MIETRRLILRQWRAEDRAPFAALNADPEVMQHFPAPHSRGQSDALADLNERGIAERGYGLYAVERRADAVFLGFVGIMPTGPHLPFDGAHEIGWRLARHAWGSGFASEAAQAALAHGFGPLGLEKVVSFTATGNLRSQAVMERIGLTRALARDFEHPALPEGHRLRRHIVYALDAQGWRGAQPA